MVFAVVEQKEPHAARMAFAEIEQPGTFAARCELARRIRDELEMPLPLYVDGMDDASRALFSDLPSPAFVVDRAGRIVDKLPWADAEPLQRTLTALLEETALPAILDAAWTVDQRDVYARRQLAAGAPAAALQWLDAEPAEPPSVPPMLVAVARASITRCHALRGAGVDQRREALAAARQHAALAWSDDVPRQLAAVCELAELAAGTGVEGELWQAAEALLDPRAPALTRTFLAGKVAAATDQTDSSARDRSGRDRAPRYQ